MTPQAKSDSSFVARYGATLLRGGIASAPSALYDYQRELNLSPQLVWFVTLVLARRWNADLPYPSLTRLAETTGISRMQLTRYERDLVERGYLNVLPRYRENGTQRSNAYDFAPLFARLEELLIRDARPEPDEGDGAPLTPVLRGDNTRETASPNTGVTRSR